MELDKRAKGRRVLIASCAAIFWPGGFIFSLPGLLGPHWQQTFLVGSGAVGQTLFFVLASVGLFMFFAGRWQEKIGPAWLMAIGAILCGGSTLFLRYASSINHVYVWSFLVGTSSAFIYIPALTAAQQWYPHKRGLASGLVNFVFAFSAALISPVFVQLLNYLTHNEVVFVLGLAALVCGLAAVPFIRFPDAHASSTSQTPPTTVSTDRGLTVPQTLRTPAFWFLWITWSLAGAAGIAMIPLSTSFGLARELGLNQAVLILTTFNLANGLSRPLSGYLSDIIGRNVTMSLAFLAGGCAYFLMSLLNGLAGWCILAAFVGYAFGTLFAVSAPLASDCFGLAHFGAILGLVFTGYGFVAGPLGPWLSGLVLDATGGNFGIVFGYLGSFYIISGIVIWFTRPPGKIVQPTGGKQE
ncbi:MAG: MFS transporter [Desulfobacterales bacterium]|jgi:OFA family oxalate/formate antiporter-like MFS transporter